MQLPDGIKVRPVAVFEIEIDGIKLGPCASKEEAYIRLHFLFLEPFEHWHTYDPTGSRRKLSFEEAKGIALKIRALDLPDWPLTLYSLVQKDKLSYLTKFSGRADFVGDIGAYYVFSQEAALDRFKEIDKEASGVDDEDDEDLTESEIESNSLEAVWKSDIQEHVRQLIRRSSLPERLTQADLAMRKAFMDSDKVGSVRRNILAGLGIDIPSKKETKH